MMKKLLILIALILISTSANAESIQDKHKAVIARGGQAAGYLWSDGFETGDFTGWDGGAQNSGAPAPTVEGSTARTGTYRMQSITDANGEYARAKESVGVQDTYHVRAYVKFSALPGNDDSDAIELIRIRDSTGSQVTLIFLFEYYSGSTRVRMKTLGANVGSAAAWTPATDGTWYRIELGYYKHASNGYVKLWVGSAAEGSPTCSATGDYDTGYNQPDEHYAGSVSNTNQTSAITVSIDDVVMNTAYIGE